MQRIVLVVVLSVALGPVPAASAQPPSGAGPPPTGAGSDPSAASVYDDASCETEAVGWADDPCAGRQWGITNIEAQEAWSITRGAGVTVAVIDTGADFEHPDLASNLDDTPGSNMLENTASTCPFQEAGRDAKTSDAIAQDDHGHGTHVAGTVAAVTDNGTGVASVAPEATVLPVKVLDEDGAGTDVDIARGICFAVDQGAEVINLSLGFDPVLSLVVSGTGSETSGAIEYAFANGVSVVIAAGNESFPACDFPASHEKALCVGAVDRNDLKAPYSNFGLEIDLVAPGGAAGAFCHDDVDIWSTILPSSGVDCGEDGYETLAGTSMASPHVAAAAALVIGSGKATAPGDVYEVLLSTADDLGFPGDDPVYGQGRVNARRAVQ